MDTQQAFNKAYLGVLKQGGISRDEYDTCVYRIQKGKRLMKCGIGHLIAKKDYTPAMEKKDVEDLSNKELLPSHLCRLSLEFLMDLQMAHDDVKPASKTPLEDFKQKMRVVAANYDLTVPC